MERVEAALDRPGFGGFHDDGQTPGRHGVRPDKTEAKAKLREVMRDHQDGFPTERALVLSFAAASTRLGSPRAQWIIARTGVTFLVAATVILATFPIERPFIAVPWETPPASHTSGESPIGWSTSTMRTHDNAQLPQT